MLENGEEYFPSADRGHRRCARSSVLLETFILSEDDVGSQVAEALVAAARRGVWVALTVDGFGTADLSADYMARLAQAGVAVRVFSPGHRLLGKRANLFRRLHRKLVAIDASNSPSLAGSTVRVDHLVEASPIAKQDYAVEVQGPAAQVIHTFMQEALDAGAEARHAERRRRRPAAPENAASDAALPGAALLVTRDNQAHRNDIEQHYLMAIRAARREIIISNAYFCLAIACAGDLRRGAARRRCAVDLARPARHAVWSSAPLTCCARATCVNRACGFSNTARRPIQ
ncbi:hypothetical protein ACTMU2_10015 [Cupriavidus basilensis]